MTNLFTGLSESPQPITRDMEVLPWTLDQAVTVFLNRWIPRVLSAENLPTIEAELRELIADAIEHKTCR